MDLFHRSPHRSRAGAFPGGSLTARTNGIVMRHVFAVFLAYLLVILAGIAYFLVIGLRHL
jgi:hypothetical protein